MRRKILYVISCFALLACNSENNTQNCYLELSESKITSGYLGISMDIVVSTNFQWSVVSSPEWCSIERKKKDSKEVLTITVHPNEIYIHREGSIVIEICGLKRYIEVFQEGNKDKKIYWRTFPINNYIDIKHKKKDNGEIIYTIKGSKIFVNPHIYKEIYYGNLINNESESIYDISNYAQYSFSNITIGTFIDGKSFIYVLEHPSKLSSDSIAEKIINTVAFQNEKFNYNDEPLIYDSYKELNLWGVGNLGIELDELISEQSYLDSEMKKQWGMMYTYCHEFFHLIMDYPSKLNNSEIEKEDNYLNLSYISQITYGKTAFLIVETDYDVEASAKIVKKLMFSLPLDRHEEELKNNMDFYYLFFDAQGNIKKMKAGSELVLKYKNSIKENEIIPLSFSLNKYDDNSVSHLTFNLNLK